MADGADGRQVFKLRVCRAIVLFTLCCGPVGMLTWPLMDVVFRAEDGPPSWRFPVALVLAAAAAAVLFRVEWCRVEGADKDAGPLLFWGSFALAGAMCLFVSPLFSSPVLATWWGAVVYAAPRRRVAVVTVLLPVLPWLLYAVVPHGSPFPVFLAMWGASLFQALLVAATIVATVWMWDVTRDAVQARRTRALLAVADERLRFSRDMDGLLGHSLSELSVRSERAGRLVADDPGRAAEEMLAVQALARESLQRVRAVVSGYRDGEDARAARERIGAAAPAVGGELR
ncbi:sensor histidine kinase [Nocardiopsis sp. CNT312]|uniref:sensor histidine kinase n=1 Tax=Nocardiopsis sp. CNT312 TaxID=1137268 RepID=UPI0004BB28B1|nr:histidine kinase dimerization/phosphoacceptor domain-containing protein [Nocardiopsis sp. CNT312]